MVHRRAGLASVAELAGEPLRDFEVFLDHVGNDLPGGPDPV